MKTIVYIIFSIFTFCNLKLSAQCTLQIDTVSFSYFNGITGCEKAIDHYKIINNSNEDYLTWVSLVPTNNKSNIELMRDFFKIRKGDFNYLELMYEDGLYEQPVDVGYTFVKKISPNETFSYYIIKNNQYSTFYNDRIVLISQKEVEKYLRQSLKEQYFYSYNDMFLLEN
jgi:hypothetical protein